MQSALDKLAKAVRDAREAKGLSQRELARKLNMNMRTIMDLEMGRSNPKGETIFLIAEELHISLDALIYTDKTQPNAVSIDVLEFFSEKTKEDSATYVEISFTAMKGLLCRTPNLWCIAPPGFRRAIANSL